MPNTLAPARRTVARCASSAALFAAVVLAPGTAHAQFGRLVKRVAQSTVERTVERTARERLGGGGRGLDAYRLAITAERLDAVLAAMRPAIATAERERGGAPARRWAECDDSVRQAASDRGTPPAVMRQLEALQRRNAEAALTGQITRARALRDSIEAIEAAQERALAKAAVAACGPAMATPAGGAAEPPAPVVPPAGMTRDQFGYLRERLGLWLTTDGAAPGFDDAERAALSARRAQLAVLVPYFQGTALVWKTWGDVSESR